MSSVSKTSKVTIIRRPDYARKDINPIAEVEISNNGTKLDNNNFEDLVFNEKKQPKKEDRTHLDHEQQDDSTKKDGITDFYV